MPMSGILIKQNISMEQKVKIYHLLSYKGLGGNQNDPSEIYSVLYPLPCYMVLGHVCSSICID